MNSESNLGKWDAWYKELTIDDAYVGTLRYGSTVTYKMASEFLADVDEIEDWGCGTAGFKPYYNGAYVGIDGSKTPWTDKIVDLCDYTSSVKGIFMRAVLEHNYEWQKILDNALQSFTYKFCLILFTPFSKSTHERINRKPGHPIQTSREINRTHGIDVPDISFSREDIESRLRLVDITWKLVHNIDTNTGYKIEHIYFIRKKKPEQHSAT